MLENVESTKPLCFFEVCYSLPVLNLARESVKRALDNPILEGLKIESDLNTLAFQTEDSLEGMNAFVDKRDAQFKDG